MKKLITGIILIIALVAIVVVLMKNKEKNASEIAIVSKKNAVVYVEVATSKKENVSENFTVNGSFQPKQQLIFMAENPGKITRVLVKEGSRVHKGQTLAIVGSEMINVNLQTAKAVYESAKSDYTRFQNAYKTGGVTKQQSDQVKLGMTTAEANYKNAKIAIRDVKIKAPISGIINNKFIEIGSVLSAMPPSPLFEIVNMSKLKLKVAVNELQVTDLKVGDEVHITTTAYPDKKFKGKLTFIASMADMSMNFPVEIEVENNASSVIKAGMYGIANFASKNQKRLIIPREAFVGSVNENTIFINDNGVARLKKITAGKIFGEKVQVIDGLKEGEQVIVTGQINLKDGTKIEILK